MEITKINRTLVWLWIFLAAFILLTLLLVNQSQAAENGFYDDLSPKEKSIVKKMEKKYLLDDAETHRFRGDAEIEGDEYIDGDVVMVKGTLVVYGQIKGTVLAVFGDIDIRSSAEIDGDIVSVNGKITTHDDARLAGDVVVTQIPMDEDDIESDEDVWQDRSRESTWHENNDHWLDEDGEIALFDYNRVDGLTLGAQFPRPEWWANRHHHFALIGKGGYSFISKRWQYQIGMERWTGDNFRFAIGGEIHDQTDTEDKWIICNHENALAAFFIKEDFRDYYRRIGFSLWASQNLNKHTKLTVAYRKDDLTNLEQKANWSLFGKEKAFRMNPLALPAGYVAAYGFDEPLIFRSVFGTFTIDSRNSRRNPTNGWYINAFAEYAGKEFDNPMQFERFILDIAHYIPLNWDEHLSFRLRGATSTGILPPVYWYDLGGISTLRAYRFKEFTGDRLVLGNVEYHLRAGDGNPFGLDVILFVDSGLAWFANEDAEELANSWPIAAEIQEERNNVDPDFGFDDLTWSMLKTDVGIALASPDGDFRIDFARRTDIGGNNFVVTFRLCQPF
ncbi:MAG: hypothetical protein EHM72_05865 [Calditrichaeota bacterium]|nr:MAG: hypothetical protein EHM72_05865 [Calditrichota bacterium]